MKTLVTQWSHNCLVDDLGCSVDAISSLDKICSGKRSCEYEVNKEMFELKPCPKGVALYSSYLEVSYECVKGKNDAAFPVPCFWMIIQCLAVV